MVPAFFRGIASKVERHYYARFTDENLKLTGVSHCSDCRVSERVGNSRPALCDGVGAEDAEWQ